MSKPLKTVFKSKIKVWDDQKQEDVEKDVELAIIPPTAQIKRQAQYINSRTYGEALKNKCPMREQLTDHLRENNLWNDDKEKKFQDIRKYLNETELKLAQGAGGFKTIEEAKEAALAMADKRAELNELMSVRHAVDARTADAIAEQTEFNLLVAYCTVYNDTGKPVFTTDGEHPSLEEYIDRSTEQVAFDSASKLNEVRYGTEKDILAKMPENQWLLDYGFVDEDFRLVDNQGRRVDRQGRLLDENGRFINEKGEFIDADGNRVDENGNLVVDFKPFVGKDGKPILPKSKAAKAALQEEKKPEAPPKGEGARQDK